jgi:hypothetical protein
VLHACCFRPIHDERWKVGLTTTAGSGSGVILTDWRRPGIGVTGVIGDRAASELLAVVDKVGTDEGWKREWYLKGGVAWRSLLINCFVSRLAIHSTE